MWSCGSELSLQSYRITEVGEGIWTKFAVIGIPVCKGVGKWILGNDESEVCEIIRIKCVKV